MAWATKGNGLHSRLLYPPLSTIETNLLIVCHHFLEGAEGDAFDGSNSILSAGEGDEVD